MTRRSPRSAQLGSKISEMQPLEEKPSFTKSPSKLNSKKSCGSSKLACAFNALKCTSRAKEEDNIPVSFPSDNISIDDSILEPDAYFDTQEPSLARTMQSKPITRNFIQTTQGGGIQSGGVDPPQAMDGNQRKECEGGIFVNPEEDSDDIAPFHREEKPRRIPSEDTNDTPNTCNRDPSKSTKRDLSVRTEPNTNFDAYCQTYFNTPRVVTSHTTLGDCITPLASPVQDSENSDEHDEDDQPSAVSQDKCVPSMLEMPSMQKKRSSTRREFPQTPSDFSLGSALVGEYITEEKKMADEDFAGSVGLTLDPDQASVKIGQQEVRAAANNGGNPERKRISYHSLTSTKGSSFSSVSTFEAITQKPHIRRSRPALPIRRHKMLTPHPFFWRSHPEVTIRSYDVQYPSNLMQSMTPQIATARTVDSADFSCLSEDTPQRTFEQEKQGTSSFKECNESYLNPAVVRKMWVESKPFDMHVNTNWRAKNNASRHPQGPPSARSGALIQSLTAFAATSLPAVFTRSETT